MYLITLATIVMVLGSIALLMNIMKNMAPYTPILAKGVCFLFGFMFVGFMLFVTLIRNAIIYSMIGVTRLFSWPFKKAEVAKP